MSSATPHRMDYNSTKEKLVIPEYGRHVQEMIRYARSVADKQERQVLLEKIVELMMQMVPQNRNIDDIREKMWKHVFRIAEYDLDATPPSGVTPTPEDAKKHPEHPGYPVTELRFRHYGHNVQELVRKALSMEEGKLKDDFVEVIGSYMKLSYKTWNKEHYISDEIIIEDLKTLSDGKLVLDESAKLDNLTQANRWKQQQYKKDDRDNRKGGGGRRRGGGGQHHRGGRRK